MKFKALVVLGRDDIPGKTDEEKLPNCPLFLDVFLHQYHADLFVPPTYNPSFDPDRYYANMTEAARGLGNGTVIDTSAAIMNAGMESSRHVFLRRPSLEDCTRRIYQEQQADAERKRMGSRVKNRFAAERHIDNPEEMLPSPITQMYPYSLENPAGIMRSYTLSSPIATIDGEEQFAKLSDIAMEAEVPSIAFYDGEVFEAEDDPMEVWTWLAVDKKAGQSDFVTIIECEL